MSKYEKFIHEFDGTYYVCEWIPEKNQMQGKAPASVGGIYVAGGYSKASASYVSRAYSNHTKALAAARRAYKDEIMAEEIKNFDD